MIDDVVAVDLEAGKFRFTKMDFMQVLRDMKRTRCLDYEELLNTLTVTFSDKTSVYIGVRDGQVVTPDLRSWDHFTSEMYFMSSENTVVNDEGPTKLLSNRMYQRMGI